MARLTETMIAKLVPDARDHTLSDDRLSGLELRLTPSGTKIFMVRARIGRHRRKVKIGEHPNMSLAQAREQAMHVLSDIRRGADPELERKARIKAAEASEMTVATLAEKWMTDHVRPKLKPRTVFDYERLLAQHILPALGHLSVARIDRDAVVQLHLAMKATPRRANYTVATTRALLNFAIDLKLRPVGSNPAQKIRMYRERLVERFLSEAEIGKAAEGIAAAERDGKIGSHAAAGLRLALFTGARSGEITAAQWSHVDWHRRLIRLPDSKTNVPRTIHLSDAAMEVLRAIPRVEPYIIAGANEGEPFKNLGRSWIVARAYVGLRDCRLHDLRHSYASLAAGRGVALLTIGKLLGHRVAATTSRYAHLARDAVAAVNDELGVAMAAAIAKGAAPPPANVVRLAKAQRRRP